MSYKILALLDILLLVLGACTAAPTHVLPATEVISIYPDYIGVTIPQNIAPLNFLLRNEQVEMVSVDVVGVNDTMQITRKGNKFTFPLLAWKNFLINHTNEDVRVTVMMRKAMQWYKFDPFIWHITSDSLDSYLSYRLIEPGYEVWNEIQIRERCVETFKERVIADNNLLENKCMNCHIYGNNSGNLSLFHLRGEGGGTMLNKDGKIRKLHLQTSEMRLGAVYGSFHPSGRYGVFSTNFIIPTLHTIGGKRLEVYDTESDLVVADFNNNRMIQSPVSASPNVFETFPTFSADGKWIYYCAAPVVNLPDSIKKMHYSLCRVSFDETSASWGNKIDTVWNAKTNGGSACHPKASPDGLFLSFTVTDYGTFPIWHQEADLQMINLQTGELNKLEELNSKRSDTYHCWSSNSRWIAFASKRIDGQYGRVYFSYVDAQGRVHKPFVLPQKNPENDDLNLKSYNIPELATTSVPFDAISIEKKSQELVSEQFK